MQAPCEPQRLRLGAAGAKLRRYLPSYLLGIQSLKTMDVIKKLETITWCKETWNYPNIDNKAKKLLQQCAHVTAPDIHEDIHDIIRRSKDFPIPFPIDTVRLEKLKLDRPIEKLNENIKSTYPIIHERLLILMANFLTYKRKYGSKIEMDLYRDMSIIDFIDRILKKRSVVFMKKQDVYKLLSGKKGEDGWESVGTETERPPLVLADCLSYDEMKLSALLSVSGRTVCINDGARKNRGVVRKDDVKPYAIIIGIIGPRFLRPGKVEYEDILITEEQNRPENGYGANVDPQNAKQMWRKIWTDFYQLPSVTYPEVSRTVPPIRGAAARDWRSLSVRWLQRPKSDQLLDVAAYRRRLAIMAELVLLEAEVRAVADGKHAFVNIIGAGLGVWKILPHQLDLYILSFLDVIYSLLKQEAINNVSDVNFAYIKPANTVLEFFKKPSSADCEPSVRQLFLNWESHPRGGINVQLQDREPATALAVQHAGKLLVLTYPWDGNAHPGNEFWLGKLSSSGDGAAACCTQVAELHNAHINSTAVAGWNVRIAGRSGVRHIADYLATMENTTSPEAAVNTAKRNEKKRKTLER